MDFAGGFPDTGTDRAVKDNTLNTPIIRATLNEQYSLNRTSQKR